MAINIFEGARRIAKLSAGLWILGWVVAGAVQLRSDPGISATFTISHFGATPVRSDPSCDYSADNARETVWRSTKKETNVRITLCFVARELPDGTKLIDFALHPSDKSLVIFNTPYSEDVKKYVKTVASRFVLPENDEAWFDSQVWPKRLEIIPVGVGIAIGGLAFLWAFTWAVGWIVRGFLGIPKGRDIRIERDAA